MRQCERGRGVTLGREATAYTSGEEASTAKRWTEGRGGCRGGKEGDLDKTLRKEEVRLGNSLRLEALGLCEGLGVGV